MQSILCTLSRSCGPFYTIDATCGKIFRAEWMARMMGRGKEGDPRKFLTSFGRMRAAPDKIARELDRQLRGNSSSSQIALDRRTDALHQLHQSSRGQHGIMSQAAMGDEVRDPFPSSPHMIVPRDFEEWPVCIYR